MLKRFFNGLVFGTGFAVALILVWLVYVNFFLEHTLRSHHNNSRTTSSEVPKIKERFLGTNGSYIHGFSHDRSTTLASGEGKITGIVTSNGKPTEGLNYA